MIPVTRSAKPTVFKKHAARWLSTLKSLSVDPNATKEQIKHVQNKYRHAQVKDALVEMFYGKCAYCESKIRVVSYGEIEHFFPKSSYPDLTFEWTNLLLSCNVCNNPDHKGTKFPLDVNGNPLLIDPTDGKTDPMVHLEFVWDDIAGLASIYGRDQRGKTVETIFDLNGVRGRKDLINHRSEYIKKLMALLRFAQTGNQEAQKAIDILKDACAPQAEYSAFALVHIRPHLPST